jgi:integrase
VASPTPARLGVGEETLLPHYRLDRRVTANSSPEQVRELLSAGSGDLLEALWVVAVHTGLRQGELLGLKWTDLDLVAGRLTVQRSLAFDGTLNPP